MGGQCLITVAKGRLDPDSARCDRSSQRQDICFPSWLSPAKYVWNGLFPPEVKKPIKVNGAKRTLVQSLLRLAKSLGKLLRHRAGPGPSIKGLLGKGVYDFK